MKKCLIDVTVKWSICILVALWVCVLTNNTSFAQQATEGFWSQFTHPAGKINVVIDTDTYNEIDDQFAVVYALLSPERLNVEAILAGPMARGMG